MELLILRLMSANQNLTKFLGSALPENEGLGQPGSVGLLSTGYLTQGIPLPHLREVTLL